MVGKMKKKVKLRKLKVSDAKRMLELISNDRVLEHLMTGNTVKDIKLDDEKKFIRFVVSQYSKKRPEEYHLGVEVRNKLVGVIGANDINWKKGLAEIGYWFGEDYWGKGYATDSIRQFSDILFEQLELKKIQALPFSFNKASQRVLEKAGYKFKKERKKAVKRAGKYLDDVVWEKER